MCIYIYIHRYTYVANPQWMYRNRKVKHLHIIDEGLNRVFHLLYPAGIVVNPPFLTETSRLVRSPDRFTSTSGRRQTVSSKVRNSTHGSHLPKVGKPYSSLFGSILPWRYWSVSGLQHEKHGIAESQQGHWRGRFWPQK